MVAKQTTVVAEGRRTVFLKHGVTIPNDATLAQALKAGGLDYTVEKVKIRDDEDGLLIPGRYLIRNAETKQPYDVVGEGYEIVQNAQAFGIIPGLQQTLGVEFGCGGVTALGRTAWIQVKLPTIFEPLDGDPHEMHLIIETAHTGKRAVREHLTPIRLDCTNQMNIAIRNATQRFAIRHVSTAEQALVEAHKTVNLVEDYQEKFRTQMSKLYAFKVGEKALTTLLERVLPDRPKREQQIDAIRDLALEAPTCEFGRGTGYAVLNAVREYFDHVRPQRTTESAFIGAMQGANKRYTDRTFELLLQRANKERVA